MMHGDGLTKLMEECGELVQIAAKKAVYPNDRYHPDGFELDKRLMNELADVLAIAEFVTTRFDLDREYIAARVKAKGELFEMWDKAGHYPRSKETGLGLGLAQD